MDNQFIEKPPPPAAAPGPCACCGHSVDAHKWYAVAGGYARIGSCGLNLCQCAAYTPQEPPVTQPDAPYPESDLASRLSRALDAKTELEIRVARLQATIGRVKAEHWNDDGMCDDCYRVWPCPTLLALSAERTGGE